MWIELELGGKIVDWCIQELGAFAIHFHRVDPEPVNPTLEPKHHRALEDGVTADAVLPIEVGLLWGEEVKVTLLCLLIPFPGTSTKVSSLTVGGLPVPIRIIFGWTPDVPVTLRVRLGRPGLFEPGMFKRSVADNKIEDCPHPTVMASFDELFSVSKSPVFVVDILIVRDIITHVILGIFVCWGYPEDVHPQVFQIVEGGDNTGEVAHSIAIGVFLTRRPDLIYNPLLPPLPPCGGHIDAASGIEKGSIRGRELDFRRRLPTFAKRNGGEEVDADTVGTYPDVRRLADPGPDYGGDRGGRPPPYTDQYHPTSCQVPNSPILCIA